jgi:hypothetical protein
MKIEIRLITSRNETPEGFPLVIEISHQKKRKQKTLCFCLNKHFNQDQKTISVKHPDYDVIAPIILDLKIKARKLILQGYNDVDKTYVELFKQDFNQIMFTDFTDKLIIDMKELAQNLGKANDLMAKNNQLGNVKVYENVAAQFSIFAQNVSLQNLDYEVLMRFRNYQIGIGNSKSTVHLYLRTVRSIYNKGVLLYKLPDSKPFTGVFANLKQRSFNSKKKYLDKSQIEILEQLDLLSAKQKYIDLFLLQFYFGGCDLIDLYYLRKKQIRRGRVIFKRTKVGDGVLINLKIHPKAQLILDKFNSEGEWLFEFKKEKEAYETFRRTYGRALIYVQNKIGLEMAEGCNLGAKVARHTFATIAKNLFIDQDIIRELQGHQRDDVDNYYKDKYPEHIRDKALFDIIG